MNNQLTGMGKFLQTQLSKITPTRPSDERHLINVGGVGGVVSAAYEQLRNAAEYTQEHLLRQRAIRRFFGRNLSFLSNSAPNKAISEELVIELTQAGYLQNDTLSYDLLAPLSKLVRDRYKTYWQLRDEGVDRAKAERWILDLVSVEADMMLDQDCKTMTFVQFAFMHYKETLHREVFIDNETDAAQFETSLYIAIHRALLKSDIATVRTDMFQLYQIKDAGAKEFAAFNENIDALFSSTLSDRLTNHLNKIGAPLRVLRSMINENDDFPQLIGNKNKFLQNYESQIAREYRQAGARLNRGVIKSILFLLITKALIGIAIEVPYDIAVTGAIVAVPLLINLFFPVVYLFVLRLGLKLPGEANTKALVTYMDEMLFEGQKRTTLRSSKKPKPYSLTFKVIYGSMFVIAFTVVSLLLMMWHFNVLQGIIFFIFFASASFLGFRLSRIIRELELVTIKAGMLSILRDFVYLPFIVLGQKMSEKYQQINIISLILDTVIELPLKTVLRLLRQWSGFLSDQKDQI